MPIWAILPALLGVSAMFMIYSYVHNHQMEIMNPSNTIQVAWIRGFGDRVFILLPGMMKRADEQFEPLFSTMRKYGSIDARAYVGHGFNLDQLARSVAQTVDSHIKKGYNVTIIGASVGGMVANRSLSYLIHGNPLNTEVIMIDTPFGVKTMKNYPNWLAFLTRVFPSAPVPNYIGNRIINKTKVGIESEANNSSISRPNLSQQSLDYLNIHHFSTWWKQLVVMVNAQPVMNKNYITMYVVCEGDGNHVVSQPEASRHWKSVIPTAVLYRMPLTAHCSFKEQHSRWVSLFDSMLVS